MKLNIPPLVWLSYSMIVGVMGAALISPLYALYREAWQLQASDISLIYVIYMGGALGALLFFGRLPDRLGFRVVMIGGLTCALLGTFISMLAWNVPSLIVGRSLVGIASSIVTTSATLGFARLSPPDQRHRAAILSGFLIALGFGVGPLVGGIFGQWAPYPLVTTYIPTLLLGALGLRAIVRLDYEHGEGPATLHWKDVLPKLTWPEKKASTAFMLTCGLPFLAFGVFGLYASMSPLFLDKLVPWHGPVVSGTAIALILFVSATTQILARRIPTHWCGSTGLLLLAASNALLMVNLWAGSASLFVLGVAFTATGHGMSMLAGMNMVNRICTPTNRSGLLSTYLVIGYIGTMIPIMGIGWIADYWGMSAAVSTFCTMVVCLGVGAAILFWKHPYMQPDTTGIASMDVH